MVRRIGHLQNKARRGLSLVVLLMVAIGGCANAPVPKQTAVSITADQLLAAEPFFGSQPLPPAPTVDLLAMTPAMREFVDFYVDTNVSGPVKLRQLQSAIIHNHAFRINYSNRTLTAAQTFAAGEGNCLSFTNMFVAMARYAGLSARYQEVDVPPVWESEAGTMILTRHINVYVKTPPVLAGSVRTHKVVDFNTTSIDPSYRATRVSDRRAKAVYYSNVGIDLLHAARYRDAFIYLREGLRLDPSFQDLWINLGALYSRLGALDYAEASYKQALRRERSMIALSNLARVYRHMGRLELAAQYRAEVERYRAENPYYRYQVARSLLERGDVDGAIEQLEVAIRLKPKVGSFYFLLGLAHLQDGREDEAQGWLDEALLYAGDDVNRRRYDHKIRRLMTAAEPVAAPS